MSDLLVMYTGPVNLIGAGCRPVYQGLSLGLLESSAQTLRPHRGSVFQMRAAANGESHAFIVSTYFRPACPNYGAREQMKGSHTLCRYIFDDTPAAHPSQLHQHIFQSLRLDSAATSLMHHVLMRNAARVVLCTG